MMYISLNFPTLLTLVRLILSPLLIPFLFSVFIPINSFVIDSFLAIIFLILSLTDFFDGFLARKYKQVTLMGALLDPIADKFLIFSTLVTLVYVGKVFFYWAILFIGREFFVMALRHVSLTQGFKIPVIPTAKAKTCFQIAYIIFAIINPNKDLFLSKDLWNILESLFLLIAFALSFYSAIQYYIFFAKTINEVK